jgi:hypothetical protein
MKRWVLTAKIGKLKWYLTPFGHLDWQLGKAERFSSKDEAIKHEQSKQRPWNLEPMETEFEEEEQRERTW